MKSQELCALLTRDRAHEQTNTRQQIAYRMQAEAVIGPDEHLFKVEFVSLTAPHEVLKLII
jgi:paired amphipathic helix protein Sin3a